MRASRRRVIVTTVAALALGLLGFVGWFAYRVSRIDIQEAYAAWDTGELLIAYMRANDNRWPGSWEQLDAFLRSDAGNGVPSRGTYFGDRQRVQTLRQAVAVDWTFDPASFIRADEADRPALRVVTRVDGTDFQTLWEGAEPNEMIRDYLLHARPATRPGSRFRRISTPCTLQ